MKKIYCVTLTNPNDSEITHCITSDDIISDDIITADDTGISYIIEKFEFENEENNMVRAAEVIAGMEKNGNSRISLKAGTNPERFKNIVHT